LWRARPDGSDRLQLTSPPLQVFNLGWSPDGKHIAFHGLSPGQTGKINIVSADGGRIETLFAGEPTGENCPGWSRDGNSILFDRTWLDKDGNATRTAVFIWDMNAHHLTEMPGSEGMNCPSWSPDGQYVVAHKDDNSTLTLFDSRSQRWKVIARGEFLNGPAWTRDSKGMVFQDSFAGEDQPIYRVSVATGKVDEVASRKQFLRADISRYKFFGLDPQDNPLAIVFRSNSDVYALDLSLP
jgi:Tol biopolymer transport system component